jgi:TldD protein
MKFSEYLNSKRTDCRQLISALSRHFRYVSILGSDVKSTAVSVNKRSSSIGEGNLSECGFVIKMHDGKAFYEYSLDNLDGDKEALAAKIIASLAIDNSLTDNTVSVPCPADEPMVKSFSRESDDGDIPDTEILDFCERMKDKALSADERLVNCVVSASSFTVSKLFITKNRELDQCYSWVNMTSYLILRDGEKMAETYGGSYGHLWSIAMADFPAVLDSLIVKVGKLAKAKPITPGVYDVITDPSIS